MKNPLIPFSEKLYKNFEILSGRKKNPHIYRALSQLYPSENVEKVYENFQIKRLATIFTVLLIGIVSAVVLPLCSLGGGRLIEGGRLVRNEWDAGDYRVKLRAEVEDWSEDISFLVEERELSEEEKDRLLVELSEVLPELIKGNNPGLSAVTEDLNLMTSVEGYPFRLVWRSENSKRISSKGKVDRIGLDEAGEWVRLSAKISYGREDVNYSYDVFLLPEKLSEKERFFGEVEEELKIANAEQKSKKELVLPKYMQGKEVNWEEKDGIGGEAVWMILLLTLFCGIALCKGMENDLERSCKKRNRQLLLDYPEFVSRLRLYLSAGLTIKSALFRMSSDYLGQQAKGKERYLYKEVKLACHQLENGMAQEQVFQEFGRRCGEMRYRRLSFLLSVHLKQGNQQLLLLLSQEADSAQEDRRSMARKAGEEAGTKLLLPMMLMMIVVMFLVLLPAYMGFGSV